MIDGITREVCIENCTRIDELAEKGADRVELNDNMAVGGTTVSYGVAENAIHRCQAAGIKVISMIRPRGGDFVYSDSEFEIMLKDLETLCDLGTDGIVFGCLTSSGSLDREKILNIIRAAKSICFGISKLDLVFHMAFDHINKAEQLESLRWLADNGVTRILTHGSANQADPIQDNYNRLKEYIAAGGIEILPGGGVTGSNFREICAELGIKQAHGTHLL
ncbi:MAG: copper homeostasis protein CutC [Treponema sp.]|nr:copper homeostasis protein CutC [Treponema sp.]